MTEPYAVSRVDHDVWSVSVPRPRGGDPAVLYVLKADDGHVLVDAGWGSGAGLEPLASALESVGISVESIVGVALTHLHIDHCGLAAEVRGQTGAWVAAHPDEVRSAKYRHGARSPFVEDLEQWLVNVGVPAAEAVPLLVARDASNAAAPIFDMDILLGEGDRLDVPGWDLAVVHTPGHSPGHLCFHDRGRKLVFAGDMILEGHVPPIWCYDLGGSENPISDFYASLDRIVSLDAARALPGHGQPVTEIVAIARRLRAHHEKRMAWLASHLTAGPATVWEAALAGPWSTTWDDLPPLLRLLALGKLSAHLIALEARGTVARTDDDPVRFAAAGAEAAPISEAARVP